MSPLPFGILVFSLIRMVKGNPCALNHANHYYPMNSRSATTIWIRSLSTRLKRCSINWIRSPLLELPLLGNRIQAIGKATLDRQSRQSEYWAPTYRRSSRSDQSRWEFQERDLSDLPLLCLFLDGLYEPLHTHGITQEAVLSAWGITLKRSKGSDLPGSEQQGER